LRIKVKSGVILSAAKDPSYLGDVCRICEVPRFARDDIAMHARVYDTWQSA